MFSLSPRSSHKGSHRKRSLNAKVRSCRGLAQLCASIGDRRIHTLFVDADQLPSSDAPIQNSGRVFVVRARNARGLPDRSELCSGDLLASFSWALQGAFDSGKMPTVGRTPAIKSSDDPSPSGCSRSESRFGGPAQRPGWNEWECMRHRRADIPTVVIEVCLRHTANRSFRFR
jgi:hypothetical protein